MKNRQNQHGFTLAELLIVVAIIGVLAGVAFVAVQTHQESLNQMELDTVAKEIFVAAQNHLTMARNENYMGLTKEAYGTPGKVQTPSGELDEYYDMTAASDGKPSVSRGVYYFSVGEGTLNPGAAAIATLILPPYALDASVLGGNYLIRYQPSSGLVLDVFYASRTGKYASSLTDYDSLMNLRGEAKKGDRRSQHVGWYGGTAADSIPQGAPLEAPVLEVENGEKLIAKITDPNAKNPSLTIGENYKIALLVTGKASQAQQVFRIGDNSDVNADRIKATAPNYEIVLDDITTDGMHFAEIGTANTANFIPGEDIVLRAVAYNETALSNIANSDEKIVNSLFEKAENADEKAPPSKPIKAYVNNIRHLENLCYDISNVDYSPGSTNPAAVGGTEIWKMVVEAEQTSDLKWVRETKEGEQNKSIFRPETQIFTMSKTKVDGVDATTRGEAGCLLPVNVPASYTVKAKTGSVPVKVAISYNGKNHSIKGITVNVDGSAGLFGDLSTNSSVKNLALIDFNVTSTSGSAGALAGTLMQSGDPKDADDKDISYVSNVLAYNTKKDVTATINAGGDAGGLIGTVKGDESATDKTAKAVIEKSAAALVVSSTGGNAGGLIGSMTGGSVIGCYSGGHTVDKTVTKKVGDADVSEVIGVIYDSTNYNVTGAVTAGGLIGNAGGTTVSCSYSTCSAKGNKVGGLVGNTSGAISKCYSTGLVLGTGTNPVSAAFAVMADGATATECNYYEIINELAIIKSEGSAEETTVQMDKVETGDTIQSIEYMVPAIKSDGAAVADTVKINALDASAESYNNFVGAPKEPASGDTPEKILWMAASPYDLTLANYYKVGGASRYNLQTVSKLGATGVKEKTGPTDTTTIEDFVATHYGDWPAPAIFVLNTPTS